MTKDRRARSLLATVLLACVTAIVPLVGQSRLVVTQPADKAFIDILDRYAQGESAVGALSMAQALEQVRLLRRVSPRWAGDRSAPDAGRRRLVVATFAIELVDQHFSWAWRPGFGRDLIEWACDLLREAQPVPAERQWHVAALALIERADAFDLLPRLSRLGGNNPVLNHAVHADVRFPGDGQWALARAIDGELASWPPTRNELALRRTPELQLYVRDQYRLVFDRKDVAAEAHLRFGYFELRRDRLPQALAEFDLVGKPDDPALRYWLHLFRGRALVLSNRRAEAIAEYRLACAEFPNAQAATLALGAELVGEGRGDEARELTSRMLNGDVLPDPWRIYPFPTYRHWPALIDSLRRAFRS